VKSDGSLGKVYDVSKLKKSQIVKVLELLNIYPDKDFSEESELSSTEDSEPETKSEEL
jgi:hypothetical protein